MDYRFGDVEIIIEQGDITEIDVEAVVNAANSELYMGSGVAGAIKRKGGISIEKEAAEKGPIDVGSAVETSAGALKAKYVIHAAVMGIDRVTDGEKIESATRATLNLAQDLGIKSIAIPALGTGVGGFPVMECAKIMFRVLKEHAAGGNKTLEKVVFVPFGYEAYSEFVQRADKDLK
ncbi:MAG: macro domain-containing protein [Candidatus Aquicultor sp.]|nr:macro domain-containing protein [Candidatus Aquicultor sp.]